MKIAFILPSLANKGPIVFTKYLIEGLKGKVDYIEVFYFRDIDLGVPTKQIGFFEKIDFDIVHTHMICIMQSINLRLKKNQSVLFIVILEKI